MIETEDGSTIMFECHGYGRVPARASPDRRGHLHSSDAHHYRRLNDAVCVGEVRAPADPAQPEPDLVLDVAELTWEPLAG